MSSSPLTAYLLVVPSTSLAYRALVRLGIALAPAWSRTRPKVHAGLLGRAGTVDRLTAWAHAHRDGTRPLVWLHASSIGEGLQAEVVLRDLQAAHRDWQFAYTHFSPSASDLARRLPVDVADYLPWDRAGDVGAALEALRPSALVFCKLDLWPELATRAAARGTAVGLIAATVSPDSKRLRWPARALLRSGYRAVALAGAISQADADRLSALGVGRERIEVTGDPRFDSALQRARAIQPDDPLLRFSQGAPTMVAGSTWPADERALLRAFGVIRTHHPDARLVLVPHEPTAEHLSAVEELARELDLPIPVRLSAAPEEGPPLLLVDRVGELATLYAGATLAFVGGGFGRSGLHSVLEPAACGVPVLFGPRWQGSPDAGLLLQRRAAIPVSLDFPDWLDLDRSSTHAGASPLAAIWLALLRHPSHARDAGARGLECIEAGAGAAARSSGLVERLVALGPATSR